MNAGWKWLVLGACFTAWSPWLVGCVTPANVRLEGHVLGELAAAKRLPPAPGASESPVVLTVTLNWTNPTDYESFARGQERLMAAGLSQPSTPEEIMGRFGPSQQAYDAVLEYLRTAGFVLVEGSSNRLTMTARGTRAQAEKAFGVRIHDYRLGPRTFFANDGDVMVPRALATSIRSISGLTSNPSFRHLDVPSPVPSAIAAAYGAASIQPDLPINGPITGAGQVIGLAEFATYLESDVTEWLASAHLPANTIYRIHRKPVAGGTTETHPETMLGIAATVGMAPGASTYNVYVAPRVSFGTPTSFIRLRNSAVGGIVQSIPTAGGARVISFSYGICETDFTIADLNTIDMMLELANAYGISFFTSSGDNGAICAGHCNAQSECDPIANTVSFPASAPHAIAVGGTTLRVGSGGGYQSESWWNDDRPLHIGGFGVSRHFARPPWQAPFTRATGRSVPDVSADADPMTGIDICYDDVCGLLLGGTSLSAPLWAGAWALVAQASGPPRRVATSALLYSLANSGAFHRAETMSGPGADFAHVGLGSPNLPGLVAPCSHLNQPCCRGTSCDPGLVCAKGTCTCGGEDQPCCAGSACNPGFVCTSGLCSCGRGGERCCPDQSCAPGFTCVDVGPTNACECGDLYQACCDGTTCTSPLLVCSAARGDQCISACGHRSQSCCHSAPGTLPPTHAGGSPGWCYSGEGVSCAGDTCTCGGNNQACCQPGPSCDPGLTCSGLVCTPPNGTTSCSTCASPCVRVVAASIGSG